MAQQKLPHNHRQAMEQQGSRVPSMENFQTVAEVFKQLGDGSRIACGFSGCCAIARNASPIFLLWYR